MVAQPAMMIASRDDADHSAAPGRRPDPRRRTRPVRAFPVRKPVPPGPRQPRGACGAGRHRRPRHRRSVARADAGPARTDACPPAPAPTGPGRVSTRGAQAHPQPASPDLADIRTGLDRIKLAKALGASTTSRGDTELRISEGEVMDVAQDYSNPRLGEDSPGSIRRWVRLAGRQSAIWLEPHRQGADHRHRRFPLGPGRAARRFCRAAEAGGRKTERRRTRQDARKMGERGRWTSPRRSGVRSRTNTSSAPIRHCGRTAGRLAAPDQSLRRPRHLRRALTAEQDVRSGMQRVAGLALTPGSVEGSRCFPSSGAIGSLPDSAYFQLAPGLGIARSGEDVASAACALSSGCCQQSCDRPCRPARRRGRRIGGLHPDPAA